MRTGDECSSQVIHKRQTSEKKSAGERQRLQGRVLCCQIKTGGRCLSGWGVRGAGCYGREEKRRLLGYCSHPAQGLGESQDRSYAEAGTRLGPVKKFL